MVNVRWHTEKSLHVKSFWLVSKVIFLGYIIARRKERERGMCVCIWRETEREEEENPMS